MKTKIIVTLGPSTRTEEDLRKIKDRGVDFVRVNMSHSTLADQEYFMNLAKKVGIPFILDTEGSQIRNGLLNPGKVYLNEGDVVKIYEEEIVGGNTRMSLRPKEVFSQLEDGDLIYIDFEALVLHIIDTSTRDDGSVTARVIVGGYVGSNKGVVIDPLAKKTFDLPVLSEKDMEAIPIALSNGVEYIAASFMRSGVSVREVRKATEGKMKIISKIECSEALQNLDDIVEKSDFLLIDRGDLSREVPFEKIPFTQKIIIEKANKKGKGVFVATNFLESMVENRRPTRAEVHDVVHTVLDGAHGLTLASETAIGKYPIEAVNTLNKFIAHAEEIARANGGIFSSPYLASLRDNAYLEQNTASSILQKPHGGVLVDREAFPGTPLRGYEHSPTITLTDEQYMDLEQIAIGTFSPLQGFLGKKDFESVLDSMSLSNGVVWPLPVVLDASEEEARRFKEGDDVSLRDSRGEVVGVLHLDEKYTYRKEDFSKKVFGTLDVAHPGVSAVNRMKPVLLGGKITLLKKRHSPTKQYELTPRQTRRLFEERSWSRIVGFHTRNVIHRSHEYIQLEGMRRANADGLFVHPVIGKKKKGDFHALPIIKSYELMTNKFYPKDKVLFGAYATFSRYAGPREALFTALCRKNFGCSHFVVGRDHTGVGSFYGPKASHEIFDQFSKKDIGIEPVRFDKVFYSDRLKGHVHEGEDADNHSDAEKLHISGMEARKMFERGETPPEWFMRPEISKMIVNLIRNGEEVFVS